LEVWRERIIMACYSTWAFTGIQREVRHKIHGGSRSNALFKRNYVTQSYVVSMVEFYGASLSFEYHESHFIGRN
jgi:hypothetical protein